MKSAINEIINEFGMEKVHYGIIVFGETATKRVEFGDKFAGKQDLETAVSGLQKPRGTPALDSALEEAKKIYEGSAVRPNAKKFLVLIMDKRSGSVEMDIRNKAKSLADIPVNVIPVAVGDEADMRELQNTTADVANLIKVPDNENPTALARRISSAILRG